MKKRKRLDSNVTSDDDGDANAFVEEHLSAEKLKNLRELARKISRSLIYQIVFLKYWQFVFLCLSHNDILYCSGQLVKELKKKEKVMKEKTRMAKTGSR